jgi:methionyl-tRNA formyltransferase
MRPGAPPPGLRIVFAGTPEFAAVSLRALADSRHQLTAVFTQPDRPAGRGRKLMPSPVKQLAQELDVPIWQPVSLREPQAHAALQELAPDVMVVVAYGLILPAAVLALPRLGCINVHASLLPRWRGAAPIQRAILAGDARTGITIMQMDAGLDTGPMLLQRSCPILPDDTGGSLHDRLAVLGAESLLEALEGLADHRLDARPQPTEGVTYADKLSKAEAIIDWQDSATVIERRIRAFNPWPVAQTHLDGEVIRLWQAQSLADHTKQVPGSIVQADRQAVLVATGEGLLALQQMQRPGGRPVAATELINSLPLAGRRFD